jgi:dihydroorotate dehydrogenase (fumarate)
MTSLATNYLGLELSHPIIAGASPIADDIEKVLLVEDAGSSAIVMRSIFEEQIVLEQMAAHQHYDTHVDAEASGIAPNTNVFALGLDAYLQQVRKIRERTSLKVIASLNGTSPGGWLDYARGLEQAGAHALELNLYVIATDPKRSSQEVEAEQLATIRSVTSAVKIPVAVKLSPFYSSLPNFVKGLEAAGARGVVLFNRVYQADIDPIKLEAVRELRLSKPEELLLRLRWLAIVSAQSRLDFAVSGGVHSANDAVRAIMAGAHVVQVVSSLLEKGASQLRTISDGLRRFLEEQDYKSISVMRGNMNRSHSPDPSAYERSDYMHLLQSWHGTFLK